MDRFVAFEAGVVDEGERLLGKFGEGHAGSCDVLRCGDVPSEASELLVVERRVGVAEGFDVGVGAALSGGQVVVGTPIGRQIRGQGVWSGQSRVTNFRLNLRPFVDITAQNWRRTRITETSCTDFR